MYFPITTFMTLYSNYLLTYLFTSLQTGTPFLSLYPWHLTSWPLAHKRNSLLLRNLAWLLFLCTAFLLLRANFSCGKGLFKRSTILSLLNRDLQLALKYTCTKEICTHVALADSEYLLAFHFFKR